MNEPVNQQNSNEWFYDSYNDHAGLLIHVKEKIADLQTKLQHVQIFDTEEFGKILVLNKYMYQAEQGTELTEMLVHVPMNTGVEKKKVLLIGGGDGISLSQLIKYPEIESIDVVDIDEELTKLCQDKFVTPEKVWQDPRIHLFFEDGFAFLEKSKTKYDLILSAVSEIFSADGSPGMAYKLYTNEFYQIVSNHLTENGIFVSDGTTVHYTAKGYEWWEYGKQLKSVFPVVFPYHFNSKRMPGGEFVLLWGSKTTDPIKDFRKPQSTLRTIYYNPEIHLASFSLPENMKQKWQK